MHDAGDHGDLVGVVLRPAHLGGERKGDERWAWLVDVLDGGSHILWTVDLDFMFTPGAGVMRHFYGILDCQPAWSLDLELQDEKFKHTLVCAKDVLKSVS